MSHPYHDLKKPLYQIPIAERPPGHGPLLSKIFFPVIFNLGLICINTTQFLLLPLLLIPFGIGKILFKKYIRWTKDGFAWLLITIFVLFAPTSLVITTDAPPSIADLVERDSAGRMVKINLPERLVIMANHQAYTDWMWIWILSAYCGHSGGLTIILKESLRNIPIVGWGMRFFNFIFLRRSWAADRENLTKSLKALGREARLDDENQMQQESTALLKRNRSPLWLLLFPEGTLPSNDERPKSAKYAAAQGVDDFVCVLHPRTTGLLFSLQTLLKEVKDLQLLDVTIGYPGVPAGSFPQDYYGLFSVFYHSVPPPTVHLHLHLYGDLTAQHCPIPSLKSTTDDMPTPEEARRFELWLRRVWSDKDKRMKQFASDQLFHSDENAKEIIPIQQTKWYHWGAAFGGGGLGLVAIVIAVVARTFTP